LVSVISSERRAPAGQSAVTTGSIRARPKADLFFVFFS
jgi:hypothetical protein